MGKTFDRLWSTVTSFENLLAAYRAAAHGKRGKAAVAAFEWRLEENLLALQADLRAGTYAPGAYTNFPIREPKRRLISAAPFRDRVVHHALVRVIEPIFERRFIHDSYANRPGKGTHRALDRCTHFMRRHAYVLPIDVKQFFPDGGEIDADVVKASVRGWINHARYGDTWGLRKDVLGRLRLAHRPLASRPPGPTAVAADP